MSTGLTTIDFRVSNLTSTDSSDSQHLTPVEGVQMVDDRDNPPQIIKSISMDDVLREFGLR